MLRSGTLEQTDNLLTIGFPYSQKRLRRCCLPLKMIHIFVDFYHGFVIGSETVMISFCSWLRGMGALRDYSSCKQRHKIEVSWKARRAIDHFTVVDLATWPLNGSEAGGDFVLIHTSLLVLCKSTYSYAN